MSQISKKPNTKNIYILFIVVFSAVYLLFICRSGWWSDDFRLWCIRGIMITDDKSLLDLIGEKIKIHWEAGRFFPITSAICETSIYLLPRDMYKIYLVVMTILCELAFFFAVFRISGNEHLAFLSVISSVLLFCVMPDYVHSVFLAFGGNALISLLFCFISVNLWVNWVRNGHKKHELLFLLFMVLSLLTYEVAYTFIFFYLEIAVLETRSIKRAVKVSYKMITAFLCVFLIYAYAKTVTVDPYEGNSVMIEDIGQNISGFLSSVTAPLPLFTWIVIGGVEKNVQTFFSELLTILPQVILLLILLFCFIFVLLKKYVDRNSENREEKQKNRTTIIELLVLAAVCVVCPAILMAVSRYQVLPLGLGYIVIIYQYFGYGLLGSLFLWKMLFLKIRKVIYAAFLLYAAIILSINQVNSYYNIKVKESSDHSSVMSADYADMIESFVKSEKLSCIARDARLVGIHSNEIYWCNSFSDEQFTVLINRAEQDDRPLKIYVMYSDYFVVWQKADVNKRVENPVIYFGKKSEGLRLEYHTVNGEEGIVCLDSYNAVAEGEYYWLQLDSSINQISLA